MNLLLGKLSRPASSYPVVSLGDLYFACNEARSFKSFRSFLSCPLKGCFCKVSLSSLFLELVVFPVIGFLALFSKNRADNSHRVSKHNFVESFLQQSNTGKEGLSTYKYSGFCKNLEVNIVQINNSFNARI